MRKVTTVETRLAKNIFLSRVLRPLTCSIGVLFLVWAFFDVRFRNAEGFLQGGFCLPISIGVALLILGWTVAGRLRRPALWFALALVGQAVALQLIEAGSYVRYQHYKPFNRFLTDTHPLILIYLPIQTALVLAGIRSRWPEIRAWAGRTFKPWQLLGIGLVFFLTSATLSPHMSDYIAELFFAAFIQTVNLGNLVLVVWSLPEEALVWFRQRFKKIFGTMNKEGEGEPGGIDRFAVLAAIWVSVIAAFLSAFVYERHPHIPDEVIYLYHARYLSEGSLTVPAPPVPEAFSFYMIPFEADRWYSIFPPGWPAVLALGVILRIPWLVNPLLAGLNTVLTYIFIREIYCRRTARMALFLLCVSPWHVFMAMNFMSHTFTLTCALMAAVAVARARRTHKIIWGWIAGFSVGMLSLIRPLDSLVVGGLLALWGIGVGGRRLRPRSIVSFFLGAILLGSIVLPYNKQITGDPTGFPLMSYYRDYFGPKKNALGFGPERGLGWPLDPFPGHSPFEALINANLNSFSINTELLGWSIGSLVPIAFLIFSGRMRKSDYLMASTVMVLFGVYSLYWFSGGPDFGARYWYLMLVPLLALTVRGVHFLVQTLQFGQGGLIDKGIPVMVAVLSMCMITFVNYFPWRAVDKYHHYRGMRPDIRHLAKQYRFGKSIVLIRNDPRAQSDYLSAWTYNPLNPYADVPIYAWDRNPGVRARVLKAYKDRPVWIINGPTLTLEGYKVIEGPLSAQKLSEKKHTLRTHK